MTILKIVGLGGSFQKMSFQKWDAKYDFKAVFISPKIIIENQDLKTIQTIIECNSFKVNIYIYIYFRFHLNQLDQLLCLGSS